jgi:CRP/FNR family transcriptional regulator, anaerobic regulatory protein
MINESDWQAFTRLFPTLGSVKQTEALIKRSGLIRRVKGGDILYRDGDECSHLPLVISGELQLTKHAESGRGITLYRVDDGESCILSTLSILNADSFPAEARSNTSSTLCLIPADLLRRLIDTDQGWRQFVFATYHQRLSGLIALIEEVVFGKLDLRLAELLQKLGEGNDGNLQVTHQELAEELGSSREVVSRLLKDWERKGIVELYRGRILVKKPLILREE